jgi:hypothetical protein
MFFFLYNEQINSGHLSDLPKTTLLRVPEQGVTPVSSEPAKDLS